MRRCAPVVTRTSRARRVALATSVLSSLAVLSVSAPPPTAGATVTAAVTAVAPGASWLAAEQKWTGYVWPIPTALAALATSAYVQPSQSVAAATGTPAPVAIFKSYAVFARMIGNGSISPDVHRVAYDPEMWAETPLAEQQSPVTYMQAFTVLAHRHELESIIVPGRSLVLVPGAVCTKRKGEAVSQAFVRCDLAAGGDGADAFVIQAAPVQATAGAFERFVGDVSRQVRAASPGTSLLATVRATSAETSALLSLIGRTAPTLDGFEVNCTNHTVQTAIDLMQRATST